MENLQDTMAQMLRHFDSKMANFQVELDRATPHTLNTLASEFNEFKGLMRTALCNIQQEINLLAKQQQQLDRCQDQLEMHTRRGIILLHGVAEADREVVSSVVCGIASANLHIANFAEADIFRCHRLGRSSRGKPRPLLVEFNNLAVKSKFWLAKTKLKGTGVSMTEFLTKVRHDAFLHARELFGLNKCWTRDGCVYIIGPDGARHRVFSTDDVDKLRGSQVSGVPHQQVSTSQPVVADTAKSARPKRGKKIRPFNEKERACGEREILEFPGKGQVVCNTGTPGQKPKVFSYNVVFEPAATQEDVLEYSGIKRLLEMAIEGFSCTAFCYGQTGSGKTHTLTGPPGLVEKGTSPHNPEHGLVVRSFVYLFKLIQERPECHFILKASFLEIYNEKVIDLLNPGTARKPLQVRWSKESRSFYVENLFTVDCEQLDDLFAVLEEGMRNRAVGAHAMNSHSSRSHTLLCVRIRRDLRNTGDVTCSTHGKINFVDLAGSEMTKKTNSSGKTLEEANNINRSLMVLGYCIAQLSDGKKRGHIPYRDSKLTKLLADSLAGNGVTLMIACIAPSKSNLSETINTLRYAARAKKIKSKPIVKMDARDALILSLKREVEALQAENQHLRTALHVQTDYNMDSYTQRRSPTRIEPNKLYQLPQSELVELVQIHMEENSALRTENAELFGVRDQLLRDQELLSRENERLLKKLEDVNSVCIRSPIIPARPTYSDEANVWTNPSVSSPSPPSRS